MERRYGALRILGTIYKILGVLVGIVTIVAALGLIAASFLGGGTMGNLPLNMNRPFMPGPMVGGMIGGVIAAVFAVLYGIGLAITLYGLGEGIYLLLALEENTRLTAQILERQFER